MKTFILSRLSKVQWMNKRCRPPPPRVPQCKYLGFWGCKDLSNSTDNFIRLLMIRRYSYFFSFSDEYLLSFELCNVQCNVLESNNKVIKFQPTAGAYSAGRLGSLWEFECNDNTWQIPFHPSLSTEKMRLFEYLQRLSNSSISRV